jgi:hypothetical protein
MKYFLPAVNEIVTNTEEETFDLLEYECYWERHIKK